MPRTKTSNKTTDVNQMSAGTSTGTSETVSTISSGCDPTCPYRDGYICRKPIMVPCPHPDIMPWQQPNDWPQGPQPGDYPPFAPYWQPGPGRPGNQYGIATNAETRVKVRYCTYKNLESVINAIGYSNILQIIPTPLKDKFLLIYEQKPEYLTQYINLNRVGTTVQTTDGNDTITRAVINPDTTKEKE